MKKFFSWLMKDRSGQGMVEYGLIIALIAIVVIGALTLLGGGIEGIFDFTADELEKASTGAITLTV